MYFRLLDGKRDFQGMIYVQGARVSNLFTGVPISPVTKLAKSIRSAFS